MKRQIKSGILAAIISLTFSSAYSQVPVQWTRTLNLEGNWEGLAKLVLSGQTYIVNYHTDFKTVVDGSAMTMNESFSDSALGDFKGANLIGLYAPDGLIHWFSADNFGTAHEHTGSWMNPKHFHMEHHSLQGGQPFVEYIDLRLRANGQKVFVSLIATLGADTVETIAGTLFRQGNCSRIANADIENGVQEGINIYPNPTHGEFDITSSANIEEIKITNEVGQVVYQTKPNETDHSLQLDSAGIYFIQITSANKTETKKIVVTK